MMFNILSILSIISICVEGIASQKPQYAVSTQSYHRGDVPLSYKYSAVHIYTPHPEQRKRENNQNYIFHQTPKYITQQYAPLRATNQNYNIIKTLHQQNPENGHALQITAQEFQYSTEGAERDHIEPRLEAENDLSEHDQKYRSYVPGHNIEVLKSNSNQGLNDLYKSYRDKLQSQEANVPNNKIHPKPEKNIRLTPDSLRAAEQRLLSEEHNIMYAFLPKPDKVHDNNQEKSYKWNQAVPAKIPRLHLNIARVYGIAHLTEQAHDNLPAAKPLSHTQAVFRPLQAPDQLKTILYPVQDPNKNYPLLTL